MLTVKLGLLALVGVGTAFAVGISLRQKKLSQNTNQATTAANTPPVPAATSSVSPEYVSSFKAKSAEAKFKLGEGLKSAAGMGHLLAFVLKPLHKFAGFMQQKFFKDSRWIISEQDDLIYLIGSVVTSYIFMWVAFRTKIKPSLLYFTWVLIFDAPHIFATVTRTYLDREEMHNRRPLLLGSLLLFLAGPLVVQFRADIFFTFAYLWAYYHLVKQHYGFMILYKKKNNDLDPIDNYIDKALIWTGFTAPLIGFMFGENCPASLKILNPYLPSWSGKASWAIALANLTIYLGRQWQKNQQNLPLNMPKQLLLFASISMHAIVFRLPFNKIGDKRVGGLALLVAILTIYHNIQYNRLIWFHNKNKYAKGAKVGRDYGLATRYSRTGKRYALLTLLCGILYRAPDVLFGRKGGMSADKTWSSFFWGFAFVHYYLDSKIWRVRRDKELNQALRMSAAA